MSTSLEEALGEANPDSSAVRELVRESGGVPDELRGKLWQVLLGVYNKRANLEVWGDNDLSPDDQATIKADVVRTRQTIDKFRTEQVQADLEKLLTVYCKRRSVKYTQGLNELIAPFFLLDLDTGAIFNSFYALMQKYLPNMLRGQDLKTLRRSLEMFSLLLRYHEPDLERRLQDAGIRPDLYATSWFVTLFSGDSSIPVVLSLWDQILIRDDALFVYFVALGLLKTNKDMLMATDDADLAEAARRQVKLSSPEEVSRVVALADGYDKVTPKCFRRQLYRGTVQNEANTDIDEMLKTARCIIIPASELTPDASGVKFFVIDSRPAAEFVKAALPTAVNLDIHALEGAALTKKVDALEGSLSGSHICLVGGDGDPKVQQALDALLDRCLPHVSLLEKGFSACVALFERGELELVSDLGVVDVSSCQSSAFSSFPQLLSGLASYSHDKNSSEHTIVFGTATTERVRDEALRVHAESIKRAKEVYSAVQNDPRVQQAAEKTKEKAKQLSQKGLSFLSSAFNKAKTVAEDLKTQGVSAPVASGSLTSLVGWTKGGGDSNSHKASSFTAQQAVPTTAKFAIEEDDLNEEEAAEQQPAVVPNMQARPAETKPPVEDAEDFEQDSPINVGHWMQKKHTRFFQCKRLGQNGKSNPRYLVVSSTHIMDLEAHKTKLNVAKLKAWNAILDLDKVTFNKKDQDVVTFIFRSKDGGKPKGYIYIIPKDDLRTAVECIQKNLRRLKGEDVPSPPPEPIDDDDDYSPAQRRAASQRLEEEQRKAQAQAQAQAQAAAQPAGGGLIDLGEAAGAPKLSAPPAQKAAPAPAQKEPAPAPAPAADDGDDWLGESVDQPAPAAPVVAAPASVDLLDLSEGPSAQAAASHGPRPGAVAVGDLLDFGGAEESKTAAAVESASTQNRLGSGEKDAEKGGVVPDLLDFGAGDDVMVAKEQIEVKAAAVAATSSASAADTLKGGNKEPDKEQQQEKKKEGGGLFDDDDEDLDWLKDVPATNATGAAAGENEDDDVPDWLKD